LANKIFALTSILLFLDAKSINVFLATLNSAPAALSLFLSSDKSLTFKPEKSAKIKDFCFANLSASSLIIACFFLLLSPFQQFSIYNFQFSTNLLLTKRKLYNPYDLYN